MNFLINIALWITYLVSLYFSVFILLVYWDKKSLFLKETSETKLDITPLVSVLVPAYNEEKTILKTLESINDLDYPKDKLQVIVIDDGSKDKTKEIITNYIKEKSNFQLLSHKNQGKAASLNKALEITNGEFFACLDADSFVEKNTLRKMLNLYYKENNPRLAIITPAMKVHNPKNLLQKVQWLEYLVIILIARISSHLDSLYVAPGPFSLYKTQIVRDIGGFDVKSITEDQEIAYCIQKEHYQIKQCFDGYVYTTAPKKIKPFYRQRRRWYLGSIICLNKHKKMVGDKNYGDFGMIQMIKNVAGYFLAITGIIFASYYLIMPLIRKMRDLFIIKFNILPYLLNLKIKFTFLSFLLVDFKKGFVIIFLFMIGFFLFYQAHKNSNEKMMKLGWIPLIPYFVFYYLLKGLILLLSLLEFSKDRRVKW
jgi:cellulose synthase/poly-beta-1,6-N-acetylglucosamine synthase-like glycosyltransferase